MSEMTVERLPAQGMLTIRGEFSEIGPVVLEKTGCAIPEPRMVTRSEDRALLWMSPDELMLVCPYADAESRGGALFDRLGDAFATVVDVSDARQVFALYGRGVENALAALMPIDFARMRPDEVRRTRMAQIPAAIWREGEGWRLMCFCSVATYARDLLEGAGFAGG